MRLEVGRNIWGEHGGYGREMVEMGDMGERWMDMERDRGVRDMGKTSERWETWGTCGRNGDM